MTTFPVVAEALIAGVWTDLSPRIKRAMEPVIKRGRADESSDVQPTTSSLILENTDGFLTPGNAQSPWYPYVKRGLPMRLGVRAGTQSLLLSGLPGCRVSTPDVAALDVTGPHFGAVELQGPPTMGPTDEWVEVVSKYVGAGNQRSWHLRYTLDGRLALFWSADGTAILSATSTRAVPVTSAGQIAFAWWLDVNNGAGGNTVTFYAGASIDAILANPTGTKFSEISQSGTTSVFSSSAPVEIGDLTGSTDPPFGGRVRRFQFRSGDSTGSIVANPIFYQQPVGTTTFTDSATRVWSLAGDAAITDKQYRFTGTVDSISLDWPKATPRIGADKGVARATFTLSGALRRMQQGAKPLHSALWRIVTSPINENLVIAYWPMEDGADSKTIASPIDGVKPMAIRGKFSLAADDTLASSSPLLNIASGDSAYMAAPVPQKVDISVAGFGWEVTRFFRIDTPSTATPGTQLMAVDTNGRVATWRLFINDTQVGISGADSDGSSVVLANFATDARFYNTWAMIVLEVTDNGANVDWAVSFIPIPLGSVFGTSGSFVGNTGTPKAIRNNMVAPPSGISTGHVIVTSGAPIGWLAGPDTAWIGETAAHRFHRLCNEENICQLVVGDPNLLAGRGDPAYSVQMGPQRPLPLIELLRECATTDLGILSERRDCDGLAFRTHRSLYNQAAAVTLNTTIRAVDTPFEPVLDDQRLRNDVEVTRPDGSSARAMDEVSIAADGLYDMSVDVNVYEDPDLPDQAGWRLHQGTWPEMRYPALTTGLLSAGPAVQDQWLHCDLGDRFTLTNLMRQVDSTVDQLIEGYEETLSFFRWDVAANGSPEGVWEVGVRNDATRGKRDGTGSTLVNPISATDTGISVTNPLGTTWTLAAGDYPFELNVGGERVRATSAVFFGAHTFTCVRSLNGVVKAHAVGEPVSLWRPTVRAL